MIRATRVPRVAVLVPVYDEAERVECTVREIVRALEPAGFAGRVIVLDDGSRDWPAVLPERLRRAGAAELRRFTPNAGKGAVLAQVFPTLDDDAVVVIDADGEYSGDDVPEVVAPLLAGDADWVLGSRYGFGRPRPRQYAATWLVNRIVNASFNLLSGAGIHDLLTGLYGLRGDLARRSCLRESRFAYTPELAWTLLRHGARVVEVPVDYRFRGYGSGKKIRWWETATILAALLRYRVSAERGT